MVVIGNSEMPVRAGDKIAVWFSCGAASAVAAKKTLEKYGDICTVRVVNNPVAEEHPDNQRFLKDVERLLRYGLKKSTVRQGMRSRKRSTVLWLMCGMKMVISRGGRSMES